jgi:hypothetical protein
VPAGATGGALPNNFLEPQMNDTALNAFKQRIEVHRKAERLIGTRAWLLVSCYGKLTEGPNAGSYVSGLPMCLQLDLIRQLSERATVPVHLMHRHKSGEYERSSLRWSRGDLFMVFNDREELA